MTTQLNLQPHEIQLIEEKRAVDRKVQQERQQRIENEFQRYKKQTVNHHAAICEMANQLKSVDKNNVFSVTFSDLSVGFYKDGFDPFIVRTAIVQFDFNGHTYKVDIEEHRVGVNKFRSESRGYKFHFYGTYNDFRHRWIKKPEALIKAVVDLCEKKSEQNRKQTKIETNRLLALTAATDLYPNCKISLQAGFTNTRAGIVTSQPDIIIIGTPKVGTLELTFSVDGERNVKFAVYKVRYLSTETSQKIMDIFKF